MIFSPLRYLLCWFCLVPRCSVAVAPLDRLLHEIYSPDQVQQVRDGKMLQDTVESGSERELSVRFAGLLKAPATVFQKVFMEVSQKKDSDPSVIDLGLIEGNGLIQDFDGVKLDSNNDVMKKTYLNASPGSDLNLSQEEINAFNNLNGTGEVEEQFRSMLLDRYRAYRKNGLSGIPPYRRSGGKDYHPSDDLRHKVELATIVKREAPEFHRYLDEYPNAQPGGFEESFCWMNFDVDAKPTVALVHRMGQLIGDAYVFAERHFYVSRSHNCIQGVGGAFPVEEGTILLYLVRTTTDQVAGFGSSAKRAIGSRIMGGKMAESFERARTSLKSEEKEQEL